MEPEEEKHDALKGLKDQPFMLFGLGIKSYFSMLSIMCLVFAFICLLTIPLFKMYDSYNAFENHEWASWTLGNLGQAKQACVSSPLELDSFSFQCTGGYIYRLDWVGINPINSPDPLACPSEGDASCHDSINGLRFRIDFYDECMHKKACSMRNIKDRFIEEGHNPACWHPDATIFVQYTCRQDEDELFGH